MGCFPFLSIPYVILLLWQVCVFFFNKLWKGDGNADLEKSTIVLSAGSSVWRPFILNPYVFNVSRLRISNDPEKQIHALNNSLYPKFTNTLPWPGSGGKGEILIHEDYYIIMMYLVHLHCTIYHTKWYSNGFLWRLPILLHRTLII